ncbi:MAG: hypothetical protein ACI4XP_06545 [Acutalibacteraceae bacterium]
MSGKREFGDYQTPIDFAGRVCDYLRFEKNIRPSVVVEPTCGIGNFLQSSLSFDAERYYGIEINPEYCAYCCEHIDDERVNIINGDLFKISPKKIISQFSDVLVIGNPPWVTNSTLSVLESDNLPLKSNFKGLKGIDAITGASNFDICEYMILRLINEFRDTNCVIAMLCKTTVARNVFRELKRNSIDFEYCDILEFDAFKVFGINASACVLVIKLSCHNCTSDVCNVYSFDNYKNVKYSFGYVNGRFLNNIKKNNYDFDGECCFEWHQGIKHDCSKIMELSKKDGVLYNGKGDIVEIEDSILFPLVKSSMFKRPVINDFSKYVLVTQKKIKEETSYIKKYAPKTWRYLTDNIEFFNKRKSSIYNNSPQFSMFGIGDYSYSEFKVGVSGFYKTPLFSLIYSSENKPVMTDDTSYFISFDNYDTAYITMLLLNTKAVQDFLTSITFLDAKRPYTKRVLNRLCFQKILSVITYKELQETENKFNLESYVTEKMYYDYKNLPVFKQNQQMTLEQIS